jgi:hypothetical protein
MPFSASATITPDSQASPAGPPPPKIKARFSGRFPVSLLPAKVRAQTKKGARSATATDMEVVARIPSESLKSLIGIEPPYDRIED